MTIEAELPDGTILEFPDGTPNEVIQNAVRQQLGVAGAPVTAQPQTVAEAPGAPTRIPTGRGIGGQRARRERETQLASLTPEQRALVENVSPVEAFLIGAGRGFATIGRGVGLVDPETATEAEAIESLQAAAPLATGAGEIVGETAPFLLPASAAGGIAATVPRVAAAAGIGAAETGIAARGRGADVGQQLFSAGIGGSVAGALELGLPIIGRIGGSVIRRVLGKTPEGAVIDAAGRPSQELVEALQRSGQSFDDIVAEARQELAGQVVDPEQAARQSFLQSQGLVGEAAPTRAQITRAVDDFKIQQEALKSSGRVEARLAAQDQVLSSRFDNQVLETGGEAVSPTSSVSDALVNKASDLDNKITELYKVARERAADDKNVRLDRLGKKLRDLAPSNRRTGGNIEAIVGDLRAKGIMDDDFNIVGRVDVETAEDVRVLMNELFDPQNRFGNAKLRELKDELDKDVFKAAGNDVFQQARKAKFDFEQGLTRAKISKFDSRKRNIVRDILENQDSVNPEQFVDKVVFGRSWRASDLQQLSDYIGDTPAGQAALNDLKAETLQKIKEKSFIGAEDAQGFRSLSRDKLERAVNSIGDEKLKVIFNDQERKFLNDMLNVAKLREPRKGVAVGLGPSAPAVLRLEKRLSNIPVFGSVFGFIDTDSAGRLATRARPQRIAQRVPAAQISAPAAVIGAGAITDQDQGTE